MRVCFDFQGIQIMSDDDGVIFVPKVMIFDKRVSAV
jgi:hypothetical protein